jgi:Na+-driven multidrug efflux pump
MRMEETRNPLGYERLPKLLRGYAVPSIIAMVVSALYNIVDQIFIGQGVGYLGNAATNVAFPLTTICLAIALLIGIGSASRFSLELGAGRPENAARAVCNAVFLMLVLGIAYAVIIELTMEPLLYIFGCTDEILPYALEYTRIVALGMPLLVIINGLSNLARADGSPKYSMACMLSGAVANTILDPIFIFVFDMGMAGAAIATVAGQVISVVMALRYLKKFRHIQIRRDSFRPQWRECRRLMSLGMSSSLNQLALCIVQIVINNSLTYYGQLSIYGKEIPLAAVGIVMKTNAILLAIIIGISQGSQPIIGFNYGAQNYARVRGIYKLAITCAVSVSVVGWILFQFFPAQIISLFGGGSDLYYEFAIRFMRTFLLMVPVMGVQILSSNFCSAIGKPLKGALLSLSRQVFLLVPLVLLLPLRFGIDGIMYAGPLADFLAFVVSVVVIRFEMGKIRRLEAAKAAE